MPVNKSKGNSALCKVQPLYLLCVCEREGWRNHTSLTQNAGGLVVIFTRGCNSKLKREEEMLLLMYHNKRLPSQLPIRTTVAMISKAVSVQSPTVLIVDSTI